MKSKFETIAATLREDIQSGRYTERLPSERDLAEQFDTTPVTIRKAQDVLIAESLLVKVPPVGTFVKKRKRIEMRVSTLLPMLTASVKDAMKASFREAFPDVDLTFHNRTQDPAEMADCDLMGIASLSAVPYQGFAIPFPAPLIEELPMEQYYRAAFDIHRLGNLVYGLPVLFSPALLIMRRGDADSCGITEAPSGLDLQGLVRLAEQARRQHRPLWNQQTVFRLLTSLIFSSGQDSKALADVDTERLSRNLKMFWPLLDSQLLAEGKQTFLSGDVMLEWTCRQALNQFDMNEMLLLNWPEEFRHEIGIAGEFLLLNSRTQHPDTAARVALHFLSPEIQQILGQHRLGLPVLKSAALDSMESDTYRDDLFFTSVRHVCTNSASEHDFYHRLKMFLQDLQQDGLGMDEFLRLLTYEIEVARKRQRTQRHFLNGQTTRLEGVSAG